MRRVTVLCLALVLLLCSCGSQNTMTSMIFDVDTGDSIVVSVDTAKGYGISFEDILIITLNDAIVLEGVYVDLDTYNSYKSELFIDEYTTVIEQSEKDGNEYFFYSYFGDEYFEWDYLMLIDGSSTGMLFGCIVSERAARECFENMVISLEK